ncbi:DUF3958 family protein [Bacillus wiedmannii]|uniref:DUF3958 domain-containing protein n=1 Tax=Bacillus wiedmannii TaxID=1890302 RepID=A0A2A7VTX5_9BACI|nr:DUF3958 family protein [Bacillus wiedmannii]PEJ02963.1 hypothetical protein CN684_25715 [Bacillus wiedmannii]PEM27142.1 hypothetical protein CN617_17265 [Bacillus wiedmannii]PHC66681.1 hypothetical protein COF35_15960 [Bacillus wiedmannii]
MNQEIEQKVKVLSQNLINLSEEQYQNQRAIQTQEQAEADFLELRMRSHRFFHRILETWHGDKELSRFFTNIQLETQQIEKNLSYKLEEQKETLIQEKQKLYNLENDLAHQKQKLAREASL